MHTRPDGAFRHAHERRSAARAADLEDGRRPALQRDKQHRNPVIVIITNELGGTCTSFKSKIVVVTGDTANGSAGVLAS